MTAFAVAPLPPELLPDVLAALARIPGAADTPTYRAGVLAARGKLAARMVVIEGQHAAGVLSPIGLAEVWAWASYLAVVRGYPEATTVAQYVRSIARLMSWCTETRRDYATLALPDFDDWQKWLLLTHRNGTDWRTNQLAAARNFYDWRSTRGIGANCAQHVRTTRRGLRMARKYTDDQIRGMLVATGQSKDHLTSTRDRTILLFLLATGARREELTRLAPWDLDLGERSGVVRFHGKGAKEREVPIEGPIVTALLEWLGMRDSLPFVVDREVLFPVLSAAARGQRMSLRAVEKIVARTAQRAKVRSYGVHRWRVNFATALYDAGAGLEEIRALLGHESIETTRRYIAVSERVRKTRLSAAHQHKLLGTRNVGQPLWMRAALGELGK